MTDLFINIYIWSTTNLTTCNESKKTMNGMVSCHSVSIHSKSRDISRAQKRIFFLTHLDVRTRSYHCNRFFNVGEFYGRQLACSMKCVAMMMMISTSHMNWGDSIREEKACWYIWQTSFHGSAVTTFPPCLLPRFQIHIWWAIHTLDTCAIDSRSFDQKSTQPINSIDHSKHIVSPISFSRHELQAYG
jgi:hypothetical protein